MTWPRTFDVVFALSFFSHMPDRTFDAWLRVLHDALAPGGLLVFTTHGRVAYVNSGRPALAPDGYWFVRYSEQKDLPVEDFGTMVVTPRYVAEALERCQGAALLGFRQAEWWDKQVLHIVRKTKVAFPPDGLRSESEAALDWRDRDVGALSWRLEQAQHEIKVAWETLDLMRRSTSWRLTAPLRGLARLVRRESR